MLPPRTQTALTAVAQRLERVGARFLVAGGTGRALLGCTRRPGDVDLEVDEPDASRAAEALGLTLRRDSGGGRDGLRAEGALGGIGLDLTSSLRVEGPHGVLEPDWTAQIEGSRRVRVGDHVLWVAPPEEHLARAIVLGDWGAIRTCATGCEGVPLRDAHVGARLAAVVRPGGRHPPAGSPPSTDASAAR